MTELLVLSGEDLRRLMRLDDYIHAVAAAFALYADGKSFAPAPVQIPGNGEGTFHIKAPNLPLGPGYVAIKINANFPQNRVTGLPGSGELSLGISNPKSPTHRASDVG